AQQNTHSGPAGAWRCCMHAPFPRPVPSLCLLLVPTSIMAYLSTSRCARCRHRCCWLGAHRQNGNVGWYLRRSSLPRSEWSWLECEFDYGVPRATNEWFLSR
ncbi:unnamed protein product, partial [Ectocarpus sp. 12 AP-2014]